MSKYKFKDDERMVDGIEIPPEKIRPFIDNEFVADFKGEKLYYTKDFDVALYKKIQEGMTYVEAYNALGFDTSVLGEERANAAGKRVMQKARDNRLFTVDETSYDGSVPREEMGDLTAEEEMAYLKARNHYLEEMLLAQKKYDPNWRRCIHHRTAGYKGRSFHDGGLLYQKAEAPCGWIQCTRVA